LNVARSGLDYVPVPEGERSHRLKRIMDELFLKDPCLGTRRLVEIFRRDYGEKVNRKMLQSLRREMGIGTLWCRRKTSQPALGQRKFPYLLRDLAVVHPNQVWCADITYVPMPHGHAYLCAVMDWYSRKVLGWAVSNTMDSGLCLEALEMALSGNDGKYLIRIREASLRGRRGLGGWRNSVS
jgi:putative transposase